MRAVFSFMPFSSKRGTRAVEIMIDIRDASKVSQKCEKIKLHSLYGMSQNRLSFSFIIKCIFRLNCKDVFLF